MRNALWIFRKDLRHLWPHVLLALIITALIGWVEGFALGFSHLLNALWPLWLLAWLYLGVMLVQQERLPGDTQYWLTRPIAWRTVLCAKAMFVVLFAVLPVAAAESAALLANGISPLAHLLHAILPITALAAAAMLAIALLAAVTASLTQVLYVLPVMGFAVFLASERIGPYQATLILAIAAPILLLQYQRRATALSRCAFAAVVILLAALPPSSESATSSGSSAVRVSFDPSPRPRMRYSDIVFWPKHNQAGINLPIRVDGIPEGTILVSEGVSATIESPALRSSAAWSPTGGITRIDPLKEASVLTAPGPFWEYVNLDAEAYQAIQDTPVHLRTRVSLTVLSNPRIAPLSRAGRTNHLPYDGICNIGRVVIPSARGALWQTVADCAWPRPAPALSYIRARSVHTAQSLESLLGRYPEQASVWEGAGTGFSPPGALSDDTEPVDLTLVTWQAIARIQCDLDIPQIRLHDYVVPHITDPH